MFSYHIDQEKNLIKIKAQGKISVMEINNHMDMVVCDEKYKNGMNSIVDLNDTFLKITFDDLPNLKSVLSRHEKIRSACKWAVYVRSNTLQSLINMAIPLLMMKRIKLRVFDNEKDAMAWIES